MQQNVELKTMDMAGTSSQPDSKPVDTSVKEEEKIEEVGTQATPEWKV